MSEVEVPPVPPLKRDEFPVTSKYVYLNHAAVGVLPQSTKEALDAFVRAHANAGVLGTYAYENRMPEFRERVGKFLGASGKDIAFLRNTSDGANAIAGGLDWKPGDDVLLCNDEFPANAIPWLALRHRGVSVRLLTPRLTPERLEAEITQRTQVVAVSWVNFADGYRHDLAALAKIAHAHGALFIVDAIQGLGAFPLDVRACDIDALYASGAKWLLALQGVGFLYVCPELLEHLQLAAPGWRSVADMWDFLNYDQPWIDDASRFEGGTPNFIGALSLAVSMELLERSNLHAIAAHILELTDRLHAGLQNLGAAIATERGPSCSSGIITFALPGLDPVALGRALQHDERIVTTWRPNGIRVAPHGYNTLEEIDILLGALQRHAA